MNEELIFVVKAYKEESWGEPCHNWPKTWFDKNSYSRWAADEIAFLLSKTNGIKPSDIVIDFKNLMDYCSTVDSETRYMFMIAREAASEIVALVFDLEGQYEKEGKIL